MNDVTRRAVVASAVTVKLRRVLFTTEIFVVPLAGPDVAVMVAVPGLTPIITPPASTVAVTPGLLDVQFTGTPVRGSPDEIRVIASSCMVLPAMSGVFSELI